MAVMRMSESFGRELPASAPVRRLVALFVQISLGFRIGLRRVPSIAFAGPLRLAFSRAILGAGIFGRTFLYDVKGAGKKHFLKTPTWQSALTRRDLSG
jgi:hypothetical protein